MSGTPDPWAFQRWAYTTRVGSPARKAVLMVLTSMADVSTGRCQAKQELLWTACEMGETTIRGHLKALDQGGFIARRPQRRRDGSRRSDEYLLLAPWIDEWPDGEPVQRPLQALHPAASAGCDQPAEAAGHNRQPAAGHNRQQAAGQELPLQEQPQTDELSEARVRALDSVAAVDLILSDDEQLAVEELADLLAVRGSVLTARDRAAIVAASRVAVGVNPFEAAKGLATFYGRGKPGAEKAISSIVALFTKELGNRRRSVECAAGQAEPRAKFTFKPAQPRQEAPVVSALPAGLESTASLEADWLRIREQLEAAAPPSTWGIWLEPLKLAGCVNHLVTELDDDAERPLPTIYLTAPSDQVSWIETRFMRLIRSCASAVLGSDVPVVVVAAEPALRVVA